MVVPFRAGRRALPSVSQARARGVTDEVIVIVPCNEADHRQSRSHPGGLADTVIEIIVITTVRWDVARRERLAAQQAVFVHHSPINLGKGGGSPRHASDACRTGLGSIAGYGSWRRSQRADVFWSQFLE